MFLDAPGWISTIQPLVRSVPPSRGSNFAYSHRTAAIVYWPQRTSHRDRSRGDWGAVLLVRSARRFLDEFVDRGFAGPLRHIVIDRFHRLAHRGILGISRDEDRAPARLLDQFH